MGFKGLVEKFHNLPLWGKVVLAGGLGLGLYYLVGKRFSSSSTASTSSEGEGVVYYPSSQESTSGSSGSGSSTDGSGYVTNEQFAEWNNAVMDSIASVAEKQVYPTDTLAAGGKTSVAFNTGVTKLSGTEGDSTYRTTIFADGSKEIYKDGRLIPEENYKYIPQEFGGTRTTGSGLGSGSTTAAATKTDPNKALQQAQAAYGAAKTAAEKQAAAAAGAAARKSGATDAGAATVWKSTQQSINTTKADPNKALQQAQAAFGAAKTAAERNAAAAAGAAARAAGATDAGAAAAWKNK